MIVGKVLEEAAARFGERTALIFKGHQFSFQAVSRFANQLGNLLLSRGIEAGDKVALVLPNCPEFAIAYFATLKIGATSVPMDAQLKEEELAGLLADAEVSAVVSAERIRSVVEQAIARSPNVKHVWWAEELEQVCSQQPDSLEQAPVSGDDTALILYTSGTAGVAKGAMLSYDNLSCFPKVMKEALRADENDVFSIVVPMSHISGPIFCNLILDIGAPLLIIDGFRPAEFLRELEENKATYMQLVPPQYIALVQMDDGQKYDLSSVRVAATFGAPSNPEILNIFKQRVPNARIVNGLGLTETSPLIALLPLEGPPKYGSVGLPVPEVEVKVVDDEGNEVAQGEVGEIICRGPNVMKGYYQAPEATAQVIKDGWLHTGDVGRFDEDGYLWVVGRKKDVINVAGLMVGPVEVEEVLLRHPSVAEAAAVRGEVVRAVVALKPGAQATERELISHCRQSLAGFKVPKVVEFRDSLLKSSSGKIAKHLLMKETPQRQRTDE